MTPEQVDIDLYAEDIEPDFNSQDNFAGEGIDLYDDAIASSTTENGDPGVESSPSTSASISNNQSSKINSSADGDQKDGSQPPPRKHQVYVGNLTWWTSDRDIQDKLLDIGVDDFVEVKFYENRSNGQSKGYCVLTVGSEASLGIIHDKMAKKEIHGQVPVVAPPTKQALNQFEAQVKTRPTQGAPDNQGSMNMNMMGPRGPMGPMGGAGMGFGPRMMMGPMRGGPRGPPMGGPPPHRNMGPNQGPPGSYNPPNRPPIGSQSLPPGPPPRGPHPGMNMMQGPGPQGPMPPRGPPMHAPMMDVRGPPPRDWNRPPMNSYPPPHGQAPLPPPGSMQGPPLRGGPPPLQMNGAPPPGAPAIHMNPAFFNPSGQPQGGPPPSRYVGSSPNSRPQPDNNYPPPIEHNRERETPAISDEEFEEKITRNITVSSSAISRAVADAAAGEFSSAIETLVTAISLIKQSKVGADDRCKILVSSLQDTLHGIETKSYGRRESSRSRERDRHRRSRRDRSRSREREYHGRERERERERYDYYSRERSRSRSPREREYMEGRESSSSRYYDERDRYREREGGERDRKRTRSGDGDRSREREREREPSERSELHRVRRH